MVRISEERARALKFQRAKRILDDEYAGRWSAATLAAAVKLSSQDLQRHFREELGKSVTQYLTDVRVHAAGELLIAGLSVTEAARLCGFPNSAALSYYFYKVMGTHASNYRFKMVGWKHGAAAVERRASYQRQQRG